MNKNQWLRIAPLLCVLAFTLILASGLLFPAKKQSVTSPLVGNFLPSFTIPLLDNPSQMFLPTQWKEQVALVNLFASWCEPCKAEHPLLMKIAESKTVNMYGIGWKDSPDNLKKYLAQNGNPFQSVGLDELGSLTLLFGISGMPETLLIDKNGKVRWKFAGPLNLSLINNDLMPMIVKLNAEPLAKQEVIGGVAPPDTYYRKKQVQPAEAPVDAK